MSNKFEDESERKQGKKSEIPRAQEKNKRLHLLSNCNQNQNSQKNTKLYKLKKDFPPTYYVVLARSLRFGSRIKPALSKNSKQKTKGLNEVFVNLVLAICVIANS